MAIKMVTKTHSFGSSGKAKLAEILERPEKTWIGSVAVRAARDNDNDVYWSDEGNAMGGFIGPSEAVTMEFEGQALIRQFTFWGDPGDKVYMTIGLNSVNYDVQG